MKKANPAPKSRGGYLSRCGDTGKRPYLGVLFFEKGGIIGICFSSRGGILGTFFILPSPPPQEEVKAICLVNSKITKQSK